MTAETEAPPATVEESLRRALALEAPLADQLAAMTAAFRRLRPEVIAAYDRLVARLEAAGMSEAAPKVGEPMPGFVLPDQDGRLVSLDALLARGPLVVSFNRGHWCAYCRLETHALARAEPEIAALGGTLVSIVPERSEFARKLRRDNALGFLVLSDIDLGYTLNLGLAMWVGEEVDRLYRKAGIALDLYRGAEGSFLPIPATFVVGRDGLVRAAFVDPDFRRRMAAEDILAALSA